MRVLLAIIVSAIIAGLITIPPPKPRAPFAGPYTFCDKRFCKVAALECQSFCDFP